METGRISEGESSPGVGFSGSDKEEILANPEDRFLTDLDCESQTKAQQKGCYFALYFSHLQPIFKTDWGAATISPIAAKSG
jgi:hypothetical protein